MVWEGEAVGILPGVDSCKVAVKVRKNYKKLVPSVHHSLQKCLQMHVNQSEHYLY